MSLLHYKNQHDDLLLAKRLIWKISADEKTLSEEAGLEKPGEPRTEDSLAHLQKLIGEVYTINDPEEFIDTFIDYIDTPPVDIPAQIDSVMKDQVRDRLFEIFKNRISEKGVREINKLPVLPENAEVVKTAKEKLLEIQGTAQDPKEKKMYTQLANAVGSLGLKKSELERTNKLALEKKLKEQKLEDTKAQLEALQEYKKDVARLEAKTINDRAGIRDTIWSWMADKVSPPTAFLVKKLGIPAAAIGIGLAAATPLGWAIAAGIGAGAYGLTKLEYVQEKWEAELQDTVHRFRSNFSISERNIRMFTVNANKVLLRTGYVDLIYGDSVKNFKIPEPPIDGDGTPFTNEITIAKGGFIDGEEVTDDGGTIAHPGAVITGNILKGGVIKMPISEEALKANHEAEKTAFADATTELKNHQSLISKKSAGFNIQYKLLEDQVELDKGNLEIATAHLTNLRMREDAPDVDTTNAQKAFDSATEAFKNSKNALAELERVKRVFDLNKAFADKPVSESMIGSLYRQNLNPELTELMKKLATDQDKRTLEGQKKLGPVSAKELADLMRDMEAGERASLLKDVKNYLSKIKQDALWGKKSDNEIKRKYPFLGKLERYNKKLFNILIAVPSMTQGTRYPKGPEKFAPRADLTDHLKKLFGSADSILGGEEREASEKERAARGEKPAEASEIAALKGRLEKIRDEHGNNPHLDGIFDVLNNGSSSFGKLNEDLSAAGNSLKVPNIFGNGNILSEINKISQKELESANQLLDLIVSGDVIVCRLDGGKLAPDRSDRPLRLKQAVVREIDETQEKFLKKCTDLIISKRSMRVPSPPTITFDSFSEIQINNTNFLKGGGGNADVKILESFRVESGEMKFGNKSIGESPEKLDLLLYTLQTLLAELSKSNPVLEINLKGDKYLIAPIMSDQIPDNDKTMFYRTDFGEFRIGSDAGTVTS